MDIQQEIDRVTALREQATQGEWEQASPSREYVDAENGFKVCMTRRSTDAAFIAAAHDALPALLDLADRMEAELAQMRARCEAAEGDIREMVTNRLMGFCMFCKHRNKPDLRYMPCKKCRLPNGSRSAFAWRGPQQKGAGHEQGR